MYLNNRMSVGRALAGIVLGFALFAGAACDTCSSGDDCGAGTCCVDGRCSDDCGTEDAAPNNIKQKRTDESIAGKPMNLHDFVQLLFPPAN